MYFHVLLCAAIYCCLQVLAPVVTFRIQCPPPLQEFRQLGGHQLDAVKLGRGHTQVDGVQLCGGVVLTGVEVWSSLAWRCGVQLCGGVVLTGVEVWSSLA